MILILYLGNLNGVIQWWAPGRCMRNFTCFEPNTFLRRMYLVCPSQNILTTDIICPAAVVTFLFRQDACRNAHAKFHFLVPVGSFRIRPLEVEPQQVWCYRSGALSDFCKRLLKHVSPDISIAASSGWYERATCSCSFHMWPMVWIIYIIKPFEAQHLKGLSKNVVLS